MQIKKQIITFVGALCFVTSALAYTPSAEVKGNIAAAAVAIFNPSFEIGFAPYSSLALDYVGIYAEESWMGSGRPFLFSMGVMGYRRYFKRDEMRGLYVGAEVGADIFRINKGNLFFLSKYKNTGSSYDVGYGFVMGAVVGHKWYLGRRLTLDINASFGWHHAMHEVYDSDGQLQIPLNATGEWLPYKAGIYLGYRLWK